MYFIVIFKIITQMETPVQWVLEALSLGVKGSGHEADHPPPSIAKVKNEWIYTFTPPICLHDMCRDKLTFTLITHMYIV
jgi:hypothetical protein